MEEEGGVSDNKAIIVLRTMIMKRIITINSSCSGAAAAAEAIPLRPVTSSLKVLQIRVTFDHVDDGDGE